MVPQDCYSPEASYTAFYTPPPKRPFPTPLQRSNSSPRPSPLIITSTPPAYRTHQFSPSAYETPSSFFTPTAIPATWGPRSSSELSPTSSAASSPGPLTPTRIFMGGIVSPRCDDDDWDEKLGLSIDVPGIVLTEPCTGLARIPSPPPKSILLLPPTSLNLPSTDPTSPTSPFNSPYSPPPGQLYSPAFAAIVYGESHGGSRRRRISTMLSALGVNGVRTIVFGLMLLLGGWHLWMNMSLGGAVGRGAVGWGADGVIDRM